MIAFGSFQVTMEMDTRILAFSRELDNNQIRRNLSAPSAQPAQNPIDLHETLWDIAHSLMERGKNLPFRKRLTYVLKEREDASQHELLTAADSRASLEPKSAIWPRHSSQTENKLPENGKTDADCVEEPLNLKVHNTKVDVTAGRIVKQYYTCEPCGKTFNDLKRFKDHRRRDRHKEAKIYQCNFCKKSYGQKSSLICHQRNHTNERPYRCRYCKKTFTDQSTHTKHERIHTGDKPYACNLCKQRFSQSGNLIRHIKTIHKKA